MRTDRLLGISNSLIRKLQDLPSLVLLGNPCAGSFGTLVTWVISSPFEKRCDKGQDHFPPAWKRAASMVRPEWALPAPRGRCPFHCFPLWGWNPFSENLGGFPGLSTVPSFPFSPFYLYSISHSLVLLLLQTCPRK